MSKIEVGTVEKEVATINCCTITVTIKNQLIVRQLIDWSAVIGEVRGDRKDRT